MNKKYYLKIFLKISFFACAILSTCLNTFDRFFTNKTTTTTTRRNLKDIPFPFAISLLITPAFDEQILRSFGYAEAEDYFFGISRFNPKSQCSWSGHTEIGSSIITNASGNTI